MDLLSIDLNVPGAIACPPNETVRKPRGLKVDIRSGTMKALAK
jgi:hypothetical protein